MTNGPMTIRLQVAVKAEKECNQALCLLEEQQKPLRDAAFPGDLLASLRGAAEAGAVCQQGRGGGCPETSRAPPPSGAALPAAQPPQAAAALTCGGGSCHRRFSCPLASVTWKPS